MRIVFIGASDLGWACCDALFEEGCNIVGILTAPQDFRISWSTSPVTNVRHRSLADLAEKHGVPIESMRTRMADSKEWLAERRPDVLVVIGWYHMIGRSLRDLATHGAVGIHGSLLPRYRGGAPLVWAIINGEKESGVTLFHFADGVDDGDVIGQESFPIADTDTIADAVRHSTEASVRLVRRYIPMLAAGTAPRVMQDASLATSVPQRKPEDGVLDFAGKTAAEAYDWVRAQTRPYPGAFTYLGEEKMSIWRASVGDVASAGAEVGRLLAGRPLVVCADRRLLRLDEVQIGDAVMTGGELVRYVGVDGTLLGLRAQEALP